MLNCVSFNASKPEDSEEQLYEEALKQASLPRLPKL